MSNREYPPTDDRRISWALNKVDPAAQKAAVLELIEESWNRGVNAGQMKERLKVAPDAAYLRKKGEW